MIIIEGHFVCLGLITDLSHFHHLRAIALQIGRFKPDVLFADYEAATKIVNLSIDRLRHYREALPIWQDADDYEVSGN